MSDLTFGSPFKTRVEKEGERLRKREALLQTAVRLFNARGFGHTSLDDVAAELGITKPTIYHFLGNKDRVLLECITRGLDQLHAAATEVQGAPGTGLDRLQKFLKLYAKINMSDFGKCTIRTQEQDLSPESAEKFRTLKREVDQKLRNLICAGMNDKSIAAADIRLTAFIIAGALNGPAFWFDEDGEKSANEIAEEMVECLTNGLSPRQG